MVHPTELLRTNSAGDEGSFVAPVGDYRNDVDCGCIALPCLNQRLNLEKYAKPKYFVFLLSLVAVFNGIIVKYFHGTSHIWSQHYDISPDTVDWVIYINEVFVGIFALTIAYWGNRIHRPKCLGTLTIYLGVCCVTLAIPEIYLPYKEQETDIDAVNGNILCQITKSMEIEVFSSNTNDRGTAFGILIMYQITYALSSITFVTHGITYIDDNISPRHSPGYIAMAFAAQRMGKQAGIYSAWIPFIFELKSIFVSIAWLSGAVQLIIFGFLLAMFPRVLPNTLLRKSVNSLLSIASGNAVIEQKLEVDGFFKSLSRLLKNKVLLLNIIAMTFMQAAVINFSIKEKYWNQSKYHVSKYNDASGYSDPTLIQITTNLLKQPLIALSYVSIGMIIAKMAPSPKFLVLWNIKMFVVVLLSFAGLRFFNCTNELKNELDGKLILPYCSWNCGCSLDGPFQPICLNGETHFSPCWAGCKSFDASLKIYGNCTCGLGKTSATEGSCDTDSCSTLWALAQTHSVVSSALLGTTFMTTLLIILRSVASKDKALALGLYLTFVSLVPYLPVRAIYDVVTASYCQMWGGNTCQFYSEDFALFVSIITISLKAIAILISVALFFFIDKIELYTNTNSRRHSGEDLDYLRRPGLSYTADPSNGLTNNDDAREINETTALVHTPKDVLVRNKQKSDSKLDKILIRTSKDDRINSYVSEGDLVPPLNSNLKLGKSTSRTSNSTTVLSTDSSLSAFANAVGDDHDSDFSTSQRPQRVNVLQKQLEGLAETGSSCQLKVYSEKSRKPNKWDSNKIEETEF